MVIDYLDMYPGNTEEERAANRKMLAEGVAHLAVTSVGEHTKEEEDTIKHKLTRNERIFSVERYEGGSTNLFIVERKTNKLKGRVRVRY